MEEEYQVERSEENIKHINHEYIREGTNPVLYGDIYVGTDNGSG